MGSSLHHKWLQHTFFKTSKHSFFRCPYPYFCAIDWPFPIPNDITFRSIYCDSKTDGWACFFLPCTWCPTAFAIPHWKSPPNKEDPEYIGIMDTFVENSTNSSNVVDYEVLEKGVLLPRQAAIVAKSGRCNAPSEELLAATLSEQPVQLLTLHKVWCGLIN
jgi:hypothetical protein